MIEQNVPMPEVKREGRKTKYPFSKMEVGDSCFFPGATPKGKESHAAHSYGYYNGMKFSGRTMDGGLRIWRTE